jgi:N-acetylneuraminic acid mutarotase
MAPMPAERDHAAACAMGSDIYIIGGDDGDMQITSTTYCYNTETNTWATLTPMPEAKHRHSVCVLDSLIYVMGGGNMDEYDCPAIISSVHRYDPMADSWSEVAPMSVARSAFGAFVLDGSIHVVGGLNRDMVATTERYCVASNSWSEVSGGELGGARSGLGVHVTRLEVNLFDSLMAEAKQARR